MRLGIHTHGFGLSPALREHAERCVDAALGPWADQIAAATVFLEVLDGIPHGLDRRCRIVVDLVSSGRLTARARHSDPERVVNRAAKRIARCVKREFARRRNESPHHDARFSRPFTHPRTTARTRGTLNTE